MTDSNWSSPLNNDADQGPHESRHLALPDDLPPVEPPSAGLIVQLFVVPAVIVVVIVGVYALFGRMASQELDWRQLTTDVRSENPHVRWRGALGLAQMLDADTHSGSESQHLSANPDVAAALSELYGELIKVSNPSEEEIKQIEFLSKALGRLEVPDVVVPVLSEGMKPSRNHDVRKHSMIGVAMLAGKMRSQGTRLDLPALVNELIEISQEPEPLFRHEAAFALGLISDPKSLERLEVLLQDPDQMVRINAAIGFARNDKLDGLPIFEELLQEAADWKLDPSSVTTSEQESAYFERMLMLLNSIKALTQLQPELTSQQRSTLHSQLDAVVKGTQDSVLRTDALKLMHDLQPAG